MVEDIFDIGFFYKYNGRQSAILDLLSKQNDVLMYTIMCYLCAKYE